MLHHLRIRSVAFYRFTIPIALIISLWTSTLTPAAEVTKPVWLVSNGFHSSIAFRVRDLPFARAIAGDPRAKAVVIGWGATDFYQRRVNVRTLLRAVFGSTSILHVIPVREAIATRFAHSDVIELQIPPAELRKLACRIDAAFARNPGGRRIVVSRGYFADSRFFAGRERFYFPKMCNVWTAQMLRTAGVPIFLPTALTAGELTHQVERSGTRRGWRHRPADAF